MKQYGMGGVLRASLKVGRTVYPFRTQLLERIGPCVYSLDGFDPLIVGHGVDHEAARSDFDRRVQASFEQIRGLEDFDRTAEQQQLWELMSRLIDIPAYERQRTITVKQIGRVIGAPRAGNLQVRWAQGGTYCIDVSKADAEFTAYHVGQWFEAVVRRNYLDRKFVKIEHVARIRAP